MRRKRNREINIFSMSALDLFASALGAFILIAIIALPYYLNTTKTPTVVPMPKPSPKPKPIISKKELSELKKQVQTLKKELNNSTKYAILGIMSKSKSFVILVDMSGSMQNYTEIIRETFNKIIDSLSNKISIQIIGFKGNDSAVFFRWQIGKNLVLLNQNNKIGAKRFMSSLINQFDSGTPTHEALLEALKYKSESILLLTDGAPNNMDYISIVNDITSKNNKKKEIHCIAIGEYRSDPRLVDFLERLSKSNSGGFVGVSNISL